MGLLDTGEALQVRRLTADDDTEVRRLLRRCLGQGPTGDRTAAFFAWKHRENPFGSSPGLAALHDGQIVGVRIFLRWQLEAMGEPVHALRAVDTATDPAHQGRGIFRHLTLSLLDDLDRSGEVDLVFNTPNGNSRPGYLKMGWRAVGTLPVRMAVVRPSRVLSGARAAARATATGGGDAASTEKPSRELVSCPFESASTVLAERGQEVQDILDEAADVHGLHTPLSLRYLRWRYAEVPDLDYRCIVSEAGGRLRGVAFGQVRPRGPLAEFTLCDTLLRAGDRRTARRLLSESRRSGADHVVVHVPRGSAAERPALRAGFVRVPHQGLALVANPRRETPVDPLRPTSWHLSLGDIGVF